MEQYSLYKQNISSQLIHLPILPNTASADSEAHKPSTDLSLILCSKQNHMWDIFSSAELCTSIGEFIHFPSGPEGKSTTSWSAEINSSTPLGPSVRSSAQQIGSELPRSLEPYGL